MKITVRETDFAIAWMTISILTSAFSYFVYLFFGSIGW
jgi:hypothetical protein